MLRSAFLFLLLLPFHPAFGASDIEGWRRDLAATRRLAENDTTLALQAVARLEKSRPADASPADTIRLLNLLARIETYRAMPEEAERHANVAREQAERVGDREGWVDALLLASMNRINLGQVEGAVAAALGALELSDGIERPELVGEASLLGVISRFRAGDVEGAARLATNTLDAANQSGNGILLAYAHLGMCHMLNVGNSLAEARGHCRSASGYARASGLRFLETLAMLGVGRVEAGLGHFGEGERVLAEAEYAFREIGTPYAEALAIFGRAESLRTRHRDREALKIYDKVVALYGRYPNSIGLWFALSRRSETLQSLGEAGAAQADLARALEVARRIEAPTYLAESLRRMARVRAEAGDTDAAYQLAAEAAATVDKAAEGQRGRTIQEIIGRHESGRMRRELDALKRSNERQAAELEAEASQRHSLWALLVVSILMLAGAGFMLRRLRLTHLDLKVVGARMARSERDFRSLAENSPDTIIRHDAECRVIYLNPRLEAVLGLPAASLLGKEPSELERVYSDGYADDIANVIASGRPLDRDVERVLAEGGTTRRFYVRMVPERDDSGKVVGVLALGRDVTAMKQTERDLEVSRTELRRLTAHCENAREEERRSIARELHDELGQLLTGLSLNVSRLIRQFGGESVPLHERLEETAIIVDMAMGVARNLVAGLRPPALDMGIGPALEWLVESFASKAGASCEVKVDDGLALDEAQASVVYRIVQESLTNVARHAKADRVAVTLGRDGDGVRLEIADNGVGFDPAGVGRNSFGLLGIRERTRVLNGTFYIDSWPGGGTRVAVRIPILPEEQP